MKSTLAARALQPLALAILGMLPCSAWSWVYPEHRDLAVLATQGLDSQRRAVFDRLWEEARAGDEQRLCPTVADTEQGTTPSCIDWAAMSAISGDHSCSSREMLETVRTAPWILQVADVAAQLKEDLARIPVTAGAEATVSSDSVLEDAQRRLESESVRARRINALRTADIRLQRADPQYATRAGSNNAHFLLPRPEPDMDHTDYAQLSLNVGAEISAIGVYSWFHLSALQKASRLGKEPQLSAAERAALARAMLADEAFALHFLEDAFSAGHIAGAWGNPSQRQGTHDYYNENGLEVFTWTGGSHSIVLMGDAHMRAEDAAVASKSVRTSIEQVLDVAAGRPGGLEFAHTPAAPGEPDAFDVCRNNTLPRREPGLRVLPEQRAFFVSSLESAPVPGLGPGLGALPRFRSEVGPFVGLSGSIDGRVVDRGFVPSQTSHGVVGGLDLSFRAGFGLDGVMGEAGDGLLYASVGFRSDSPSSNRFKSDTNFVTGNLAAAIPARAGLSLRFRMPFYLVPGDLLLLSPLYLINPEAYTGMAVTAANGGLIPWQYGWSTKIGRFQFVLGRELGIVLYGELGHDQLLVPRNAQGGEPFRIVQFKSTAYDLPILEYRPYRAFSTNQSSSVVFQLFTVADVPRGGMTVFPVGALTPDLHTVWAVGLRLVFDWRYYR
jgi:hypothetical protein